MDGRFKISNIDIYRPFRILFLPRVCPVLCSRQFSPVSRKCIYRNVIFRTAESRLTCAWFTLPSVSHVLYVTAVLFSTICPHVRNIHFPYYYVIIFRPFLYDTIIYICISVRRNVVASFFFYSLTSNWLARRKIVLT